MRVWIQCRSQSDANNLVTALLTGFVSNRCFPAEISREYPTSVNVDFGNAEIELAFVRTWSGVSDCGSDINLVLPPHRKCLTRFVAHAVDEFAGPQPEIETKAEVAEVIELLRQIA